MTIEELTDFEIPDFSQHPLYNLPGMVAEHNVCLKNGDGKKVNFGAHFHGFGKGLVKGGNLCFQKKNAWTVLDFKVNVVARLFLERIIRHYSHNLEEGEAIPYHLLERHSTIEDIKVEEAQSKDLDFPKHILSPSVKCLKISVPPLGVIYIGNPSSGQFPNHARHIVIQTKKEDLATFHKILAVLGLQKVLVPNSPADNERMKIATLFRTFFPKEATRFERSNDLFTLGIAQLKRHITDLAPPMKMILDTYLSKMETADLLPGRKRITVPVTEIINEGNRPFRLMTAVTGDNGIKSIAHILKLGLLSQEFRRRLELEEVGLSNEEDARVGSDDSVFIQILSEPSKQFDEGYFAGIHLILSKEILNTGTYQYFYDSFGNRVHQDYNNRPTIFELVNSLVKRHASHEVMVKERIPPEMIEGIVVVNHKMKNELIESLSEKGLIQDGEIFGKPIGDFIQTRTEFEPSYSPSPSMRFQRALSEIYQLIQNGDKEAALDSIEEELDRLDSTYFGCHMFPELAQFKNALIELRNSIEKDQASPEEQEIAVSEESVELHRVSPQ